MQCVLCDIVLSSYGRWASRPLSRSPNCWNIGSGDDENDDADDHCLSVCLLVCYHKDKQCYPSIQGGYRILSYRLMTGVGARDAIPSKNVRVFIIIIVMMF